MSREEFWDTILWLTRFAICLKLLRLSFKRFSLMTVPEGIVVNEMKGVVLKSDLSEDEVLIVPSCLSFNWNLRNYSEITQVFNWIRVRQFEALIVSRQITWIMGVELGIERALTFMIFFNLLNWKKVKKIQNKKRWKIKFHTKSFFPCYVTSKKLQ